MDASILIPAYDKLDYTKRCLAAVAATAPLERCEVVVVDNASTDGTPAYLATLAEEAPWLKVVTLAENAGFIGANNAGIDSCSGDVVVFLNNDTEPRPGWLEALLAPLERDPSVGAVGAKLVYPDGRLQEAGGIVFSDASAANYGWGTDPSHPRYAFLREVDYCSAACLAVRADLLRRIGGFDERFAPAYYEDTDLCFEVRRHGFRVVYQPEAAIVHHEGATNGTDTSAGLKRYQVVNRQTFAEKWKNVLPGQRPGGSHARLASDRAPGKRILVVDTALRDDHTPELLRQLHRVGNRVTLLTTDGAHDGTHVDRLRSEGIEVYDGDPSRRPAGARYPYSFVLLVLDSGFDAAILSPAAASLGYGSDLRVLSPATDVLVADPADRTEHPAIEARLERADGARVSRPAVAARGPGPVEPTQPRHSVLLIADELPKWDRSSGGYRLLQIVEQIRASGADVTFLARGAAGLTPPGRYVGDLEALGVDVIPADPARWAQHLGMRLDDLPPLDLEALLRSRAWDVVYVYFHHVAAQYLDAIERSAPTSRIVVDSVDVHFLRERRAADLAGDPRLYALAEQTRLAELDVYGRADTVVTVTDADRAALLAEAPGLDVRIIPNIHPLPEAGPGFAARRDLLFVGGFPHRPNVDAALWFHAEVWPLVASRLPDVRVQLVGDQPPDAVRALASDRVLVPGYVEDLTPVLAQSRVSIAPLRYGAGMKGKVGQALAAGLPVVATTVAVEGMGLEPGCHALVADDAAAFADAVVRLYEDDTLWTSLATAGRELVRMRYAPETVGPLVVAALANPPELANAVAVAVAFADRLLARPALLDAYVAACGSADPLTLAIVTAPEEVDPLVAAVDADVSADLLIVPRPTRSSELTGLTARADAIYSDVVPTGYEALPRFDETTLPELRRSLGLDRARAA